MKYSRSLMRLPAVLFPALLASLLTCTVSTPATAQTPLLEVDHQNSAVFHVLSDGTVYLPLGAAPGYVLTADGDGYGTWQAVSGDGLSSVSSDATLSGDGTPGSPLGVAVPLALTGTANGIVQGVHTSGNIGALGLTSAGIFGTHANNNYGILGHEDYGAYGEHTAGHYGHLGSSSTGAYGRHNNGHRGLLGGHSSGAFGTHANGNAGALGSSGSGAYGRHDNDNVGYLGHILYGAYGEQNEGPHGYLGGLGIGVGGVHNNGNKGYLGHPNYGVYGDGTPYAGYFDGNVEVTGTLSKGGGSFKIDHPLDPANRYLAHSFVESPDMKNVYDGTVTTDAHGEAVVALPAYFEVLNRDFRYQLTVLGTFAQAIVAEEIQGNQFVIRTDQPGVKVSWQVTGIRQDRWANEHRIVVEEAKPTDERGFYLHPSLYGQPEERSVEWARDPEGMRAMQERPQRMETERQRMDEERQQIEQERQRMQAERERMQAERAQRTPRPRSDNGQ